MRISGATRIIAAAAAACALITSPGCTINSVLGDVKPETSLAELSASGSGRFGDIRYVTSKSYPTASDPAFEFSEKIRRGSVEDFALIMHTSDISVYYYYGELLGGSADGNSGYYAIDLYRHNSGERTTLLERENVADGGDIGFCSVLMSKSEDYLNSIVYLDDAFYSITYESGRSAACDEAAMSDSLRKYIRKYVGSSEFICLDLAKMSDHVAAVFMNNDERSDDYQKTAVVTLEFNFARDKPEKRITDWEEYYVNESDNLTFDPAQFGNYITSSVDADTGDVIFLRNSGQRVDETRDTSGFYSTKQENLSYIEFGYISTRGLQDYDESHAGGAFSARNFRISKGKRKVAREDASLSGADRTAAVNRRLITFTLLCDPNEQDKNSGKPIQYLMLIFDDAIEMWKLEESENWVGNVKLTPKFQFYVPFEDGESLKLADGLNQVMYSFEEEKLYTAGMQSGVLEFVIDGKVGELNRVITENAAFIIDERHYLGFPDREVYTERKQYIGGETQPRSTTGGMEPYDMSDLAYSGRYILEFN